jgi:hypothetical protein
VGRDEFSLVNFFLGHHRFNAEVAPDISFNMEGHVVEILLGTPRIELGFVWVPGCIAGHSIWGDASDVDLFSRLDERVDQVGCGNAYVVILSKLNSRATTTQGSDTEVTGRACRSGGAIVKAHYAGWVV